MKKRNVKCLSIHAYLWPAGEFGWSIMLDETMYNAHDLCPINIIFVSNQHMFYVNAG